MDATLDYDARRWFWHIGSDESRFYSSEEREFVNTIPDGFVPTRIVSEEELWDVLRQQAPECLPFDPIAYAAQKRWEKEVGGMEVGGISIATDDRSKLMIAGARIKAESDPDFTTSWVGAHGSIHTVNAAQVIAISDAVLAHVAGCFEIYAEVIAADPPMTEEQIDAAFA